MCKPAAWLDRELAVTVSIKELGIQLPDATGHEDWLLSSPERTMVQLVAKGLPDRVIAQQLDVSESQVREQLLVIFRKLAVAGLLDQLLYVGGKTI
jgi:DNA-binding NarL/FixJ family response regulator